MSTPASYIQVFEHQTLRVGQQFGAIKFDSDHFEALAQFASRQKLPYYSLIHQGVKFSQYVGAIQVGNLTIEILPKADRAAEGDQLTWQKVLLDMLQACQWIKMDSLGSASLRQRPNSILHLYFSIFLEETERLLSEGLVRSYFRQEGQARSLKGQLLFTQQLRHNLIHQERSYIAHSDYDYGHPLNHLLLKALQILEKMPLPATLYGRTRRVLARFPHSAKARLSTKNFSPLSYDRKTYRYEKAITIAQLLLQNFSPDIRFGQHHLIAVLFDMNRLFEEYVYQQLLKHASSGIQVRRQSQKRFWARRKIQPDILLTVEDQNFILDTKWKIPANAQPSIADLKQMFVYSQYFNAEQTALLYPSVLDIEEVPAIPYASNASQKTAFCRTLFLPVLKNGALNHQLGKELLEVLLTK